MKFLWTLMLLSSRFLIASEILLTSGLQVRSDSLNKSECALKFALGDQYSQAQQVALKLPFPIRDTCNKMPQATDSCATLLKLLIDVNQYPSEFKNDIVIENIKKNTAAIAEFRLLSPQTTNQLVKGVLNKNPIHKYDSPDWRQKFNWEEEIEMKNLFRQFPPYLKEECWKPAGSFGLDPTCYELALLFYGLSQQRDKNGAYHENNLLIKKIIKAMKLDCFTSGLYTTKQLVADFIKAGESSTVD